MKKNLLFMLALLVSVSVIFVSCGDKDEEVVNGSFAADVAGTYVGTVKYPAALSALMGSTEDPIIIEVEKTGDNTVSISYYEEDEETGKKEVSKREPEGEPDGEDPDGEEGDEEVDPADGNEGDEYEGEDPVFENVGVSKQGNTYIFAETIVEIKNPDGNSIKYVLTGSVTDKKIALKINVSGAGDLTAEGTLKETKE